MKEQFGDVEIVILESSAGTTSQGDGIVYTSTVDIPSMKHVVTELARSFGTELKTLADTLRPDILEVKVSLTLSQELKAWVIGVKGDQTFSLSLTWKKERT